jgi:hypothetical protein
MSYRTYSDEEIETYSKVYNSMICMTVDDVIKNYAFFDFVDYMMTDNKKSVLELLEWFNNVIGMKYNKLNIKLRVSKKDGTPIMINTQLNHIDYVNAERVGIELVPYTIKNMFCEILKYMLS